jgi:hypothetical protein
MEPLDYEVSKRKPLFTKFARRVVFISGTVIASLILALLLLIVFWGFKIRYAVSGFNEKTSNAKMIGKSANELTSMLGPPDDTIAKSNGFIEWTYYGPYGAYCRMNLRRGVVESTNRWQHH